MQVEVDTAAVETAASGIASVASALESLKPQSAVSHAASCLPGSVLLQSLSSLIDVVTIQVSEGANAAKSLASAMHVAAGNYVATDNSTAASFRSPQ